MSQQNSQAWSDWKRRTLRTGSDSSETCVAPYPPNAIWYDYVCGAALFWDAPRPQVAKSQRRNWPQWIQGVTKWFPSKNTLSFEVYLLGKVPTACYSKDIIVSVNIGIRLRIVIWMKAVKEFNCPIFCQSFPRNTTSHMFVYIVENLPTMVIGKPNLYTWRGLYSILMKAATHDTVQILLFRGIPCLGSTQVHSNAHAQLIFSPKSY